MKGREVGLAWPLLGMKTDDLKLMDARSPQKLYKARKQILP